jgi:Predicted EndoIII-related endonuclease
MSSSLGETIVKRLSEVYKIEKDEFAPLNFKDPFLILISIILSQNTTDKNALKAMKNLLASRLTTPQDFLKAGTEKIKQLIKVAGLYEQKANTIISLASWTLEKYGGDLTKLKQEEPEKVYEELTRIKGIGPKTADVFLVFYLKVRTFPIDTHIRRVVKRIGIAEGSYENMKKKLLQVFPDPFKAHILLIKHGRTTCTARNPKCNQCVINNFCKYYSSLNYSKKDN